jgi:hypothetical protein
MRRRELTVVAALVDGHDVLSGEAAAVRVGQAVVNRQTTQNTGL